MASRTSHRTISRKHLLATVAGSVLCLGSALQVASAASAPVYGASVYVQAGATTASDGGWGFDHAGTTLGNAYGEAYASAGFLGFSPVASASVDNAGIDPGYGKAIAGIDDWLTFTGPEGASYGDVTLNVLGSWSVSYTPGINNGGTAPWVRFSIGLTRNGTPANTYDSWRSLVSGSVQSNQSYLDTVVNGAWSELADSNPRAAQGTYAFGFKTRVYYGWLYHLGLAVIAEAPSGATAFIDDPLRIDLPAGVTFTTSSVSTYTQPVPIPPSALMFGSAVFGLLGVLRRKG